MVRSSKENVKAQVEGKEEEDDEDTEVAITMEILKQRMSDLPNLGITHFSHKL